MLAEIIVLMEFQSTRGTDKLCQRVSDILFRRRGEAVYHDQRGQIQCATAARVSVITVFHFEPFSGQKWFNVTSAAAAGAKNQQSPLNAHESFLPQPKYWWSSAARSQI
jgi:hypothetical protein